MRLLPSTSIVVAVAVAAVVLVVSALLAPCSASDASRHDDVIVAVGDAEPEEGAPDNDMRREEERYHVDPLHDMSDEELEGICSRRGFELSPPTSDGNNSYSHEDYVDAAMECLRIESDM